MIKIKPLLLFMGTSLVSASAIAAFDPPADVSNAPASVNVDNGYAGLKWTFGEGFYPEILVGFRHASVSSNGYAYGGDASVAFKVFDGKSFGVHPGKLRLKYFNGSDYLQGEVGGGYDFGKGSFFAGIGGQAPFSNIGLDYNFTASNPLEPFFMLNSLGQYSKPRANHYLTCPAGLPLTAQGLCGLPPV